MDTNWHSLIVLSLISFGLGHAIFRQRGFLILVLILFVVTPLLLGFLDHQLFSWMVGSMMVGGVYSWREGIVDRAESGWYRLRSLGAWFQRKTKNTHYNTHQHTNQSQSQYNSHQQASWEAEQARREQEARARRQQSENQQQTSSHQYQQESSQQQNNQYQQSQSKQSHQQEQTHRNHQQQSQNDEYQERLNQQRQQQSPVEKETDQRSPMEILGLQPDFTPQELKRAYSKASAQCHPDRWANKPMAVRKAMEDEQKQINWAYQQLK